MIRVFLLHLLSCSLLMWPMATTVIGVECVIPPEAALEDTSAPDTVVGNGTPESCTSADFLNAVAGGGIITFDCGPAPKIIILEETAKVYNNTSLPDIVIDGGNKISLSGGGDKRILYMNTCDKNQVWTTSHCQNQDHPRLTVQNITFINGNAEDLDPSGGGAIFVRGGRFKALHSKFFNNRCDTTGPDVGGAAIRTLSQYDGQPVYIVDSVFGGAAGLGNTCSNGGGLSSIGVSTTVINSLFSHNSAVGNGANPAKDGTPGGGSGAAIYNDGNTFDLKLCGTSIHDNTANEGGTAIFYVSNNRTGTLTIDQSALWNNPKGTFETTGYPGIFYQGKDDILDTNSTITEDAVAQDYITADVNGDGKIGLAEIIHSLRVSKGFTPVDFTDYVRKEADIVYDHEVDVLDTMAGLKVLTESE